MVSAFPPGRLSLAALVALLAAMIVSESRAGDAAEREAGESTSDWPCWRGPSGDNVALDSDPPIFWSTQRGVIWKQPVPGRGHASPCVIGDLVLIASADEANSTQFLLALDRRTGQERWRTDVHHGVLPKINDKNSQASATPASDGQRVFTLFAHDDQLLISAIDLTGRILWQRVVGEYKHANGLGASPVIYDQLVIVASDNTADPAIVALRAHDGSVEWRTPRKASENSATPIVAVVAGRPQLLINGAYAVNSYDPATGAELWRVEHNTEVAACTMAFDDHRVYASGNVPEPCMLGVRADGSGNVTDSHVLWRTNQSNTYVPSPLSTSGRLFVVTDTGVAFCRELETGEVLWKKRLGGNFSASPVFAGGNIYATGENGVTHVFTAADQYLQVAENDLEAACLASPVFCGGMLYLRTDSEIYCIGGKDTR